MSFWNRKDLSLTILDHQFPQQSFEADPQPLLIACETDRADIVEWLISRGADVNFRSLPLAMAIKNNSFLVAEKILNSQLIFDFSYWELAIRLGRFNFVDLFLTLELDIDNGKSCSEIAVRYRQYAILRLLLERRNKISSGLIDSILEADDVEALTIVEDFYDLSAIQDDNYNNLLFQSVITGASEIFTYLRDKRQDIPFNVINRNGQTILHLATLHNRDYELDNLLPFAISEDFWDTNQELIDIDKHDNKWDTVLIIAVISSKYNMVQKILQAGANPNIADSKKRRPLELVRDKDVALKTLLIKYGAK